MIAVGILMFVALIISYADCQPPVLVLDNVIVNVGQRASFTCKIGAKDGDYVYFLKQNSGEVPQLILYNHHSFTAPKYGPGMSSAQYTSSINSAGTEYQLIITKAEATDTSLYYCVKWYSVGYHSDKQQNKICIYYSDYFPYPHTENQNIFRAIFKSCAMYVTREKEIKDQNQFHSDMNPIVRFLCSSLLLIADVFCQTPVLSPSTHSAGVGQSVTFNCVTGVKDSDATAFIRQYPGETPKKILHNYHSYSAPVYGPGFSSNKFSSTINSAGTEYQLTVKNLEVTDTAVYYCAKWYTARAAYHCDI
ncbi:uncharacterized protein LOC128647295 [Bombina bombina]|uniref:uncharacterized protein LOC128647295 n=1 Tax=Bombina bombina TaxID=8345 RepID=UPI00235A94D2|nr:uncharacterized protein LOC128647295 [Bombina bombina]